MEDVDKLFVIAFVLRVSMVKLSCLNIQLGCKLFFVANIIFLSKLQVNYLKEW